jgi:hypothetical protein
MGTLKMSRSPVTIERCSKEPTMSCNLIELSTPGEVLKEEFLDPLGITP